MPTPTGDVTIDFTGLPNTNPYTPTNFAKISTDTGGNIQVASGAVKATSAFGSLVRYLYQGAMDATKDITATIEVGVAHVSDVLYAVIANPSTGAGYILGVNNTAIVVYAVTAAGVTSGLDSGSVASIAAGDNFSLNWNHTTHLLTASQNGTTIFSVTDSTYTSGMSFGLGLDPGNNNTATLLGFGGSGISGTAAALASSATEATTAAGTITNSAYAPIPLDQANVDQLYAGAQPNDGTGTPGRSIVIFLKNWAAKLNTQLQQLFGTRLYQQPATGFNLVVPVGVTRVMLDPAGTLASGTINFPASALDGQPFVVMSSQTITALTCSPASGQTVNGAPTTISANSSFAYEFRATNSTWYRLR